MLIEEKGEEYGVLSSDKRGASHGGGPSEIAQRVEQLPGLSAENIRFRRFGVISMQYSRFQLVKEENSELLAEWR